MRRQNPISGIPDSDQSISEEEDSDDICLETAVSLEPSAKNQEELTLPMRLDFLRGASKRSLDGNQSSSSFEKPTGIMLEDEVELPDFEEVELNRLSEEIAANSSDEEVISEDEGKTAHQRIIIGPRIKGRELCKDGACSIRSEQVGRVNKEYEGLLHVKESMSCSASNDAPFKANRCSDENGSKAKPKFSQQSLSNEHELSGTLISNCYRSQVKIRGLPQTTEAVSPGISACSIETYPEDDDDEVGNNLETEPAEEQHLARGLNLHSMADLVDNLQDKAYSYFPHYCRTRGKKVKHFPTRSRSLLQVKSNGEDSPEPMDSGSNSDNEVSDQNMKIAFPEKKLQTMADRFQQALGASCVADEGTYAAALKSFGAGIFGNLQRIMQKEKERDVNFLKKSQAGASPHSGLGGVEVKIISRYLDGKLIVCCCSFSKYTEEFLLLDNSTRMVYGGQERTVIFNPRVSDVDLEVGNMIRIHPPWKEVRVGNGNIILCTYFTEIPCRD